MNGIQKIGMVIAITGLLTALVLPGRQTASVVGAGGKLITDWTRVAQGRG